MIPIATVSAAVDLLVELITQAQKISSIIQQAQAANQTQLTADQWASIVGDANSSEARLAASIAAAKASAH